MAGKTVKSTKTSASQKSKASSTKTAAKKSTKTTAAAKKTASSSKKESTAKKSSSAVKASSSKAASTKAGASKAKAKTTASAKAKTSAKKAAPAKETKAVKKAEAAKKTVAKSSSAAKSTVKAASKKAAAPVKETKAKASAPVKEAVKAEAKKTVSSSVKASSKAESFEETRLSDAVKLPSREEIKKAAPVKLPAEEKKDEVKQQSDESRKAESEIAGAIVYPDEVEDISPLPEDPQYAVSTAEVPAAKKSRSEADMEKRETKKTKDYDESQIKHLDALEHIRLRSGMYIGRLGDGSNQNDGIYVLLKEIIDNAIDEYIMGYGKHIDVIVKDNRVKVRDYGRGIPLGKVVECVSEINTGAKYNDEVFQFSVGMNGVGTKAVNALSSYFRVVSVRDGKCTEAVFQKGKLLNQRNGTLKEKQPNGTFFEFVPDVEIFGKYNFNMEFVEKRIWNYVYLNAGLTIKLNGAEFHSENGLFDLLNKEIEDACLYPIGSYEGEHLKFAFTHTNAYGENYFSYVNGQYTADGGTHLNAFKEGFVKGINEFFNTNFKSEDIRDGMTAAILVKIKDPVFESQTKNKLGNTDIRQWIVGEVQSGLDNWLHRNSEAARKIKEKIEANEKLRTELSAVKKEAKEAAKKISIRIPKLKDCKYHVQDGVKGENSMIFITEGDSASGTMTHSRDASYQAIFSLRGKPENMYGKKQSEIYKNDELYQLMMALGIETDVENLKYSKIVIATDADNDGYHIRNLVMTFFLGYFEELVTSGRVYILETPLFRVRNKKENIYCYSEEERDKAIAKLGRGCETTRFKGLGEINPSEFSQFINPETMHLTPVEISQLKAIPGLLSFYMGKNTPDRRTFIENHLLQDIDA